MVKAGDSWVFQYPPSWKPPDLNCTAVSHEPKKQGLMPSCVNSGSPLSPPLAGFTVSGIPQSLFHQTNASTGSICDLPCHFRTIPPALNSYFKENASLVSHEQRNSTLGSPEKKFLVFDQSEKGTRLIYGSSSPFQKLEVLRKKPCEKFHVAKGAHAANFAQFELDDLISREESGENHIDGEESVMHEDTEEINALLYSDDDEEDGDEDEEDEVTSTGHTPSVVVQCCGKRGHVEDRSDEVGNFRYPNKRQKPIDIEGDCFNSLRAETPSIKFGGSSEHESDADSSFVMSQDKKEDKLPALVGEFSKTDKIRQMMKILEGIVPGTGTKDPVGILDEAIEYLKTMRLKAKVLGLSSH